MLKLFIWLEEFINIEIINKLRLIFHEVSINSVNILILEDTILFWSGKDQTPIFEKYSTNSKKVINSFLYIYINNVNATN